MPLKDDIFSYIQKTGPKTNAELVTKFKIMKASMRRSCGELAKEGRLAPMPGVGPKRWGVSADARVATAEAVETPATKEPQEKDDAPVDTKDWRMTDFCF